MSEEILITIKRRSRKTSDQKKTLVVPSKRSGNLGRRRRPSRMNFWDLAMVSTGPGPTDWTMLDFSASAPDFDISPNEFNTVQHQELLDKLFEQPVATWDSYYKKIVPGMNYQTIITGYDTATSSAGAFGDESLAADNPHFTDKGLRAPSGWFTHPDVFPAIGFEGAVNYLALPLLILGSGNPSLTGNKVTAEYDITADAVEFVPARKMDVFIVPTLPRTFARIWYEDGMTQFSQELNNLYWLYDRGIFLTPSHDFYNAGNVTAGVIIDNVFDVIPGNQTKLDNFFIYAEFFKTLFHARGRYNDGEPFDPFTFSDDGSLFDTALPATYDATKHLVAEATIGTDSFTLLSHSHNVQNVNNQMLLYCVVRQHGQYYYFWNLANTP